MLPGAICRTCLTTSGMMYNLFGPDEIQLNYGKDTVADFIGLLTRSLIQIDDGLPTQICQACYFEAQRAYIFKAKCDRSHAVLMQLRNVRIKLKKLKSDSSTDTSRKKEMLFLNGLNTFREAVTPDNNAMTTHNLNNEEIIQRNLTNQTTKSDESCSTKYVEFLEDPLNLIEFEQLGGSQMLSGSDIDLNNVMIKEEALSDEASNLNDENYSAENSVFGDGSHMKESSAMYPVAAKSNNDEEQNFECPVCPYVHVSSGGLEKHMIKTHMVENVCTICNKDIIGCEKQHFAQHVGLQVDYDEMIGGSTLIGGDYQCVMCAQCFKTCIDLDTHVNKHHNNFGNIISTPTIKSAPLVGGNGLTKVEADIFNEIIEETMDDNLFQTSVICHQVEPKETLSFSNILQLTNSGVSCNYCLNTYVNQDELDKHVKSMHSKHNNNDQAKHNCPNCTESFVDKVSLAEHVKTHDPDKPFKCTSCEQRFRFKHNLDCHMRFKHCVDCKGVRNKNCKSCYIRHGDEQRFECDICQKVLSNRSSLHRHKRMHTAEKPYKCEHCSQSFNYKQILNLHVKEKHGEIKSECGDSELQCKTCSRMFGRKIDLVLHMKSHDATKAHRCPHCPKSFDYHGMLVRHLVIHTGDQVDQVLKSVSGSERFSTEEEHNVHVADKQTEATTEVNSKMKCDDCDQSFEDKNLYDEHVLTHLRKKPFECQVCKQTFRYVQSLTRHTKTYHTRTTLQNYPCQLCPMSFNDRSELVNHFRSHTGEKAFECEICMEKFTDKMRLGAHMVLKHDGKGVQKQYYKCDECSKVIWNKALFDIHVKTHELERNTTCEFCGQNFDSIDVLKQHVDEYHSDIDMIDQQVMQVAEQCEIDSSTTMLVNHNVVYENHVNENNFVFDHSFLNDDQMMGIQSQDTIMCELFDESSIEVA